MKIYGLSCIVDNKIDFDRIDNNSLNIYNSIVSNEDKLIKPIEIEQKSYFHFFFQDDTNGIQKRPHDQLKAYEYIKNTLKMYNNIPNQKKTSHILAEQEKYTEKFIEAEKNFNKHIEEVDKNTKEIDDFIKKISSLKSNIGQKINNYKNVYNIMKDDDDLKNEIPQTIQNLFDLENTYNSIVSLNDETDCMQLVRVRVTNDNNKIDIKSIRDNVNFIVFEGWTQTPCSPNHDIDVNVLLFEICDLYSKINKNPPEELLENFILPLIKTNLLGQSVYVLNIKTLACDTINVIYPIDENNLIVPLN
jgi:hypothetical protein